MKTAVNCEVKMNFIDEYSSVFEYPPTTDHGIEHHREVMRVYLDNHPSINERTARLIALHDCFDHKYAELCKRNEEVAAKLGLTELVKEASQLSWSKRSVYQNLSEEQLTARYCDWITAIDLERCIQFTRNHLSGLTEEQVREAVLEHCKDKLVKIRDELPEPYKEYALTRHIQLLIDIEELENRT